MSKFPRPKPKRLPEKLKQIRKSFDYSQDDILKALGLAEVSNRSLISGFELGTKEPPLPTLLKYARLAGISTDVLIDDELNLEFQRKKDSS